MKYIVLILSFIFAFSACNLITPKYCDTACPPGQKHKLDCSCYTPKRVPATELQQREILQAILSNNEQTINGLFDTVNPDSPLNLNVLPDINAFKNIYANNIDIFTRLTYQTNNLTLLSLLAPLNGFNDTFKTLLNEGANPNLEALTGVSPLQIAIMADQPEKVILLLNAGASANFEGPNNILIDTLNLGKYKALKALSIYAKNKKINFTFPAHYFVDAMINNQSDLASALLPLTSKETLNKPNNFGILPLVQAAFIGDINLMDTLITNGADLELRDEHSRTPLLAFLQEVYIGQIEGNFPKEHKEQITNIVKYMIEKGANKDVKDEYGEDILFYAVRENNVPLIELLLTEYKHNINTKNNQGETPLFLVAQNAPSLVPMFLGKGANPKIIDKNGRTPAIAAAEMGYMDIYDLLENSASMKI